MSRSRTDYQVSLEKFCLTWNSSKTASEVSEKLGMPKDIVLARASTYRRMGIKLNKLHRESPKATDVNRVNLMLAELEKKKRKEPELFQTRMDDNDIRKVLEELKAKVDGKRG